MSDRNTVARNSELAVELLAEALFRWNIELSPADRLAYEIYAEMLVEWNSTRFNLTRLTTPEQIALNHFLDSLALSQAAKVPANALVIDIGTGAGFPGLAFKILRRDLKLVLIESTAKKLSFCEAVASEIGLQEVEFVHGRAEDASIVRKYGKTAGVVTARAVAPLKTLIEWTAPLIAPGGIIVAWKGSKVHEEVAEARQTSERLDLKMEVVERPLSISGTAPVNHFYVICRSKGS